MKKFLKNNLKTILAVSATAIICVSGTTFAALQYKASEISYKDGKNVEQALNELYSKKVNYNFNSYKSNYEINYQKKNRTVDVDITEGRFLLVVDQFSSSDHNGTLEVTTQDNITITSVDNIQTDLTKYANASSITYGASSILKIYKIESKTRGTIRINISDRSAGDATSAAAGMQYSIIELK